MSCDTSSKAIAGGPAGGSGISALSSKAAHYAGKALGVAAGGMAGAVVGGGLGSLVAGPGLGTAAGVITGAVAGGALGSKRYDKRQVALQGKAWRESVAGKKALVQFDQTVSKLKTDHKGQAAKFKAQQAKIEDDYEQAKTAWLAKNVPEKDVRKKAVAGSLAAGGIMMAVETLAVGKVTGAGAGWSALASVVTYPEQVERLKNAAWKKSPEGQKTDAQYIRRMDNLKTRWRQAKGEYETQKAAAENKYEIARAKALAH